MHETVLFLFALMAAGWAARKYVPATGGAERALNQYLFNLALPALTVVKIADTSFTGLGFLFVGLNLMPLLGVMLFIYAGARLGLFARSFARLMMVVSVLGNMVYLGFPSVALSLGPENIGYAALVSSLQNVFIFTFGFFFIGLLREDSEPAVNFRRLLLRNALLWSSLAGLFISYKGITIPGPLHYALTSVGKTTMPLSLFALGMGLYGKSPLKDPVRVGWITGIKMVLLPACYLGLARLTGFGGIVAKVTFLQLAMPVAVLNYIIAREYEFDADLVSQSIVLSTLLLFPLLFVYQFVLRHLL